MEAIILAGGQGSRLRAAVPDLPKPLAPIGKRPFLTILLDYLERQGFRRVIVSVGYRREDIIAACGLHHGNIELSYSIEETPLGTGGALHKAMAKATEDEIFAINGDTFFAIDYQAMLVQHKNNNAPISVALWHSPDTARYGKVLIEENRLVAFQEKGSIGAGWINGGVYLLHHNIFDRYDLPKAFSFEQDFLQLKLSDLAPAAYLSQDYFIDIGIPEDYKKAQLDLPGLALRHD